MENDNPHVNPPTEVAPSLPLGLAHHIRQIEQLLGAIEANIALAEVLGHENSIHMANRSLTNRARLHIAAITEFAP